jgi:hypothetical protein
MFLTYQHENGFLLIMDGFAGGVIKNSPELFGLFLNLIAQIFVIGI